jgi:hypothetical protein
LFTANFLDRMFREELAGFQECFLDIIWKSVVLWAMRRSDNVVELMWTVICSNWQLSDIIYEGKT